MKTLAIETSCDDTSLAIIEYNPNNKKFEENIMKSYTQTIHNKYWWVVPELASREHANKILLILDNIIEERKEQNLKDQEINKKSLYEKFFDDIDFISYTRTPWLPGALIVWEVFAKTLWNYFDKEVIPINHIHWHIFSILLWRTIEDIEFPMITLTVSWWHNNLYLIDKKNWKIEIKQLWQTLDDAAWECFDKISRMLGWPYPWWRRISEQAKQWKESDIKFKRIFLKNDLFNFSFSGLKSQVSKFLDQLKNDWQELNDNLIHNICYEIEQSITEVLSKKLIRAWILHNAKTLSITWWVSANDTRIQQTKSLLNNRNWIKNQYSKYHLKNDNKNFNLIHTISKKYCTDNAAMIGVVWILKKLDFI